MRMTTARITANENGKMMKLDLKTFYIKRKKRVQLLAKGNIECRIDNKRKQNQLFFQISLKILKQLWEKLSISKWPI